MLKRVTYKHIMIVCDVSESTAKRLYKDIKNEYNLKSFPTIYHLNKYLGVNMD